MAIRTYRPETRAPAPVEPRRVSVGAASDTSGTAAVGAALAEVGRAIEGARQAQMVNDARLDMTRGIGELNRDLGRDTDFGDMRERYAARLDELRKTSVDAVSNPQVRGSLELEFARARVAAEARIDDREMSLRGSHARAAFQVQMRETINQIPQAQSPQEEEVLRQRAAAAGDALVEAGYMSPEQLDDVLNRADDDVADARAISAITDNPAAAAAALSEPGAMGLDEVSRERYRAQAQRRADSTRAQRSGELTQRVDQMGRVIFSSDAAPNADQVEALLADVRGTPEEARLVGYLNAGERHSDFATMTLDEQAAILAAEAESGVDMTDVTNDLRRLDQLERTYVQTLNDAQERDRILSERVETTVGFLVDGDYAVNDAALAQLYMDAEGTEYQQRLDVALQDAGRLSQFRGATPSARQAELTRLQDQGVDPDDPRVTAARIDALRSQHQQSVQALGSDPIAYALDVGIPGAEGVDLAGGIDLTDPTSLQRRATLANRLTREYGAVPRFLSDDERDQLADTMEAGTPEDQVAVMQGIISGLGADSARVFDEIGGVDRTMRLVGNLAAETGNFRTALTVLRGRRAMAAGDEMRMPAQDVVEIWDDSLSGAFAGRPAEREDVITAAKAYYAQRAPGRVEANDLRAQRDLMSEAVQQVTGGRMERGTQFGGVQEVNGRLTRLPSTANGRSIERVLRYATADQIRAASITGEMPDDDEGITSLNGMILQETAQRGVYRVGRADSSEPWLRDSGTTNGLFYLRLDDLADAYAAGEGGDLGTHQYREPRWQREVIEAPVP